MDTNELLIGLVDLHGDYTEGMKEKLTEIALPFIDQLNRLRDVDKHCCDIRECASEAFTEAFADELNSREMAKCLKSYLLYEGGEFYEIARWHFFFETLKNKKMWHWS